MQEKKETIEHKRRMRHIHYTESLIHSLFYKKKMDVQVYICLSFLWNSLTAVQSVERLEYYRR